MSHDLFKINQTQNSKLFIDHTTTHSHTHTPTSTPTPHHPHPTHPRMGKKNWIFDDFVVKKLDFDDLEKKKSIDELEV